MLKFKGYVIALRKFKLFYVEWNDISNLDSEKMANEQVEFRFLEKGATKQQSNLSIFYRYQTLLLGKRILRRAVRHAPRRVVNAICSFLVFFFNYCSVFPIPRFGLPKNCLVLFFFIFKTFFSKPIPSKLDSESGFMAIGAYLEKFSGGE